MGCHILIEKPVDIDLERCYRFFEKHEEPLVIQVGYNLRFIEAVRVFRESIKASKIGIVTSAFSGGSIPSNWRNQRLFRISDWYQPSEEGTARVNYEIDSVEWILGK